MNIQFRFADAGLASLIRKVTAAAGAAGAPAMQKGFAQAGQIYLSDMRRRFVSASRGDGTWVPLAPSTIARRRQGTAKPKGGKGKKAAPAAKPEILRDTGLLLNSLSLGAKNNVNRLLTDGVAVGTRVKYAKHHQAPSVPGRPPMRTILVQPNAETAARIKQVLQAAVVEAVKTIK